jgi:hypothetical protein
MTSNTSPFNKLTLPELTGPNTLFFGTENAKLKDFKTATFSIPAGYTCPGAKDCLAWFDRDERKLKDGPDTLYRCFAASGEAAFPSVRNSVDRNLAILKNAKTVAAMAGVIDMSLPSRFYENIRVHVDGDYYSQPYFEAWIRVARENPERLFYGYTKSLPLWIKLRPTLPSNLVLTASLGGKWDFLIEPNKLRSARVVYHPDEADLLGLEIDHDDSHARNPDGGDFALLIHNHQPAGSEAAKAIKRLKADKIKYSYSKKK